VIGQGEVSVEIGVAVDLPHQEKSQRRVAKNIFVDDESTAQLYSNQAKDSQKDRKRHRQSDKIRRSLTGHRSKVFLRVIDYQQSLCDESRS
jgi:hypothetical protein